MRSRAYSIFKKYGYELIIAKKSFFSDIRKIVNQIETCISKERLLEAGYFRSGGSGKA